MNISSLYRLPESQYLQWVSGVVLQQVITRLCLVTRMLTKLQIFWLPLEFLCSLLVLLVAVELWKKTNVVFYWYKLFKLCTWQHSLCLPNFTHDSTACLYQSLQIPNYTYDLINVSPRKQITYELSSVVSYIGVNNWANISHSLLGPFDSPNSGDEKRIWGSGHKIQRVVGWKS